VAFAFDSAAAWCRDYYEQRREAEREERQYEVMAALRGVSLADL